MTKFYFVTKKYLHLFDIFGFLLMPHTSWRQQELHIPFKETFSLVQFTFSIVQSNIEKSVFLIKLPAYNLQPF